VFEGPIFARPIGSKSVKSFRAAVVVCDVLMESVKARHRLQSPGACVIDKYPERAEDIPLLQL
jgi:hypothetical protein